MIAPSSVNFSRLHSNPCITRSHQRWYPKHDFERKNQQSNSEGLGKNGQKLKKFHKIHPRSNQ